MNTAADRSGNNADGGRGHTVRTVSNYSTKEAVKAGNVTYKQKKKQEQTEWEEKYRFFSHPFNFPEQKCEFIESYRLKALFDVAQNSKHDEVLLHEKDARQRRNKILEHPTALEDREREMRGEDPLQERLREYLDYAITSADHLGDSSFTGYKWKKYKYFSGGLLYPDAGTVNRFQRLPKSRSLHFLSAANEMTPSKAFQHGTS